VTGIGFCSKHYVSNIKLEHVSAGSRREGNNTAVKNDWLSKLGFIVTTLVQQWHPRGGDPI